MVGSRSTTNKPRTSASPMKTPQKTTSETENAHLNSIQDLLQNSIDSINSKFDSIN